MLSDQLQEAIGEAGVEGVVSELLERAEGSSRLARLVLALDSFIAKTQANLRATAAAGVDPGQTYWPAVHQAAEVVYAARQLGVIDSRSKAPSYRGGFDPRVLRKILDEIARESPFHRLARAAREARAQMGVSGRNRPLVLAASRDPSLTQTEMMG